MSVSSDHRELNLERFNPGNYLANGWTEVPEAKFEAATDAFLYLCNMRICEFFSTALKLTTIG